MKLCQTSSCSQTLYGAVNVKFHSEFARQEERVLLGVRILGVDYALLFVEISHWARVAKANIRVPSANKKFKITAPR